jgi:hypothetical protein
MKHTSKFLAATLVLASSAWLATAQTADDPAPDQQPPPPPPGERGPGPGRHRMPPPAFIAVLDANHDGVIDADEIAGAAAALKTLDKDGDGQLTILELMAPPPPPDGTNAPAAGTNGPAFGGRRGPGGPPPGAGPDGKKRPLPPIINALDANHDGVIDATELANAPAALKTLDKNGDGQLTIDEIRPAGRGPGGRGPGPHQGPPPGDEPPPADPQEK